MLEVKNYTLEYIKGKKAVDDISFEVQDGDIFGFVGSNGAGKSTTIKSIVGINHITAGDILIDNVSIIKKPLKYKEKIAYIPDEPAVYENITGIEYLNFISDIYDVPYEERNKNIEYYSKRFMLEKELNDLISSYSHGMKQKLILIAAFMHNPKVYILDEPFASLDPEAAFVLKEELKKKAKEGKIIFFSTHVLEVAEKICNKVAIIIKGKIVKEGKMEEVITDKSLEETFLELVWYIYLD